MLSSLILCLFFVTKEAYAIRIRVEAPDTVNNTVAVDEVDEVVQVMETTRFHTTRVDVVKEDSTANAHFSFSFATIMSIIGAALIVIIVCVLCTCRYYAEKRRKEWDLEQQRSREIALERVKKMEKQSSHTPTISVDSTNSDGSTSSKPSLHSSISSAASMSFESDCQLSVF